MAVYNPKSMYAYDFINHEEILETLEYAERNKNNLELIDSLLEKARPKKTAGGVHCAGLTHREASVLLACENPEKIASISISAVCTYRSAACRTSSSSSRE